MTRNQKLLIMTLSPLPFSLTFLKMYLNYHPKCHHLKKLILSHQFTLISAEENQNAEIESTQMERGGSCTAAVNGMGLHTRLAHSNHCKCNPSHLFCFPFTPKIPAEKHSFNFKVNHTFPFRLLQIHTHEQHNKRPSQSTN